MTPFPSADGGRAGDGGDRAAVSADDVVVPRAPHQTSRGHPRPNPSPIRRREGRAAHAPGVVKRARWLRKEMTLPEKLLWKELRGTPLHVRKQAPMGRYVADFIIHDCRLVIEVDGSRHLLDDEQLHDAERDAWFASQGYRTLRFTNAQVMDDREKVLSDIQAAVQSPPSPTLPPSRGKGDRHP